jgi:hypothetical protein
MPLGDVGEQLHAVHRNGLVTVTAAKVNKVNSVTVKVEGK